jgi:hypothetical protein
MCLTCFGTASTHTPYIPAGMAIGTGSGLAHAAIDRVFSSKHPEPAEAAQAAQQIAAAPAADVRSRCDLPDCIVATPRRSRPELAGPLSLLTRALACCMCANTEAGAERS